MGGQDMTNAITRRFGLEAFEAEALKRDPQEQVMEVQDAVYPVLDDLGNEINLSFDFFENQFDGEVQEVYLSWWQPCCCRSSKKRSRRSSRRSTRVWNPIEGLKIKSRQRRHRRAQPNRTAARCRGRTRIDGGVVGDNDDSDQSAS